MLESVVSAVLDERKVAIAVVRHTSIILDNSARLRRFPNLRFVTGSSARPGVPRRRARARLENPRRVLGHH